MNKKWTMKGPNLKEVMKRVIKDHPMSIGSMKLG